MKLIFKNKKNTTKFINIIPLLLLQTFFIACNTDGANINPTDINNKEEETEIVDNKSITHIGPKKPNNSGTLIKINNDDDNNKNSTDIIEITKSDQTSQQNSDSKNDKQNINNIVNVNIIKKPTGSTNPEAEGVEQNDTSKENQKHKNDKDEEQNKIKDEKEKALEESRKYIKDAYLLFSQGKFNEINNCFKEAIKLLPQNENYKKNKTDIKLQQEHIALMITMKECDDIAKKCMKKNFLKGMNWKGALDKCGEARKKAEILKNKTGLPKNLKNILIQELAPQGVFDQLDIELKKKKKLNIGGKIAFWGTVGVVVAVGIGLAVAATKGEILKGAGGGGGGGFHHGGGGFHHGGGGFHHHHISNIRYNYNGHHHVSVGGCYTPLPYWYMGWNYPLYSSYRRPKIIKTKPDIKPGKLLPYHDWLVGTKINKK